MRSFILLFILSLIGNGIVAQHTFSIVAVDTVTGEVGSAGASCIANSVIISDVHPGVGAIHTQSYYIVPNQEYGSELMNNGYSPEEIIDSLVTYDQGGDSSIRQYGVVDLIHSDRSAAFTGTSCLDWKGHITGPNYSIQGNILLGPEIISGMEEGFLNTDGNLACKLMGALQGAKVAGADTRCLDWGISAESAFLRVAQPGDSPDDLWLDVQVKDVNGVTNANNPGLDPIDSLQTAFDAIGGCDYTGSGVEMNSDLAPIVYPQPAFGIVIFSLEGTFNQIVIYNLQGESVFQKTGNIQQQITIDCRDWVSGLYAYTLSQAGVIVFSGSLSIQN